MSDTASTPATATGTTPAPGAALAAAPPATPPPAPPPPAGPAAPPPTVTLNALEIAAKRQATWSTTANAMKKALEDARRVTFALAILGALLATLASQTDGDLRRWIAIAGTIALAVGTFLTARLLGGSQTTDWVRARAASEALKREAYKCAVQAAPYEDPATRMRLLRAEVRKIEDPVLELLGKQVEATQPGSSPTADVGAADYIRRRVQGQIDWYIKAAEKSRQVAKRLGWAEFLLALAATVITAVFGTTPKPGTGIDFVGLAAVLTTIGGAVVAHVQGARYDFQVTTYRATARRLENELAEAPATFTVPSQEWSDFVGRCETILADENGGWLAEWSRK